MGPSNLSKINFDIILESGLLSLTHSYKTGCKIRIVPTYIL